MLPDSDVEGGKNVLEPLQVAIAAAQLRRPAQTLLGLLVRDLAAEDRALTVTTPGWAYLDLPPLDCLRPA